MLCCFSGKLPSVDPPDRTFSHRSPSRTREWRPIPVGEGGVRARTSRPVYWRAARRHKQTYRHCRVMPARSSVECGRKARRPGRTRRGHSGSTCKLLTERRQVGVEPPTMGCCACGLFNLLQLFGQRAVFKVLYVSMSRTPWNSAKQRPTWWYFGVNYEILSFFFLSASAAIQSAYQRGACF